MFGPLLLKSNTNFTGTDDKAKNAIIQIAPNYKPWIKNIWQPPGKEMESFLFAVQAGVGSFIMGYILGFGRGKKAGKESRLKEDAEN